LPQSLPLEITYNDGTIKSYQINLNEPKLSNYSLSKQVYEDDKIFGDIEGDISGYIKHYDIQYVDVEVFPEEDGTIILPPKIASVKTLKQTGKTEINGNYKRWEYYYSDKTTYWGDWKLQRKDGWQNSLRNFLGIIILLFYSLFFLYSFLQLFVNPRNHKSYSSDDVVIKKRYKNNDSYPLLWHNPKPYIWRYPKSKNTETKTPQTINDSIISNFWAWQSYDSIHYSGYIKIRNKDYKDAGIFRNNLSEKVLTTNQYNAVVSKLTIFDKNKFASIYYLFDSLKLKNKLNEMQFAEMITCFVQTIPYTLILENNCNANLYNDEFIKNYLMNGGQCEGYVKYGLFSPIEFMGNLKGDCDTRTLLLFTILSHYRFEVAILGSELYRHSVIGINLPYNGVNKIINGSKYYLWETTLKGLKPGMFPHEISEMRFWNVNLISNNNPSI
jgi:hypothetical protein